MLLQAGELLGSGAGADPGAGGAAFAAVLGSMMCFGESQHDRLLLL